MIKPSTQPGGRLLDGTIAIFAAEALVLPTGLLIVAILTRRSGPAGYGLFACRQRWSPGSNGRSRRPSRGRR